MASSRGFSNMFGLFRTQWLFKLFCDHAVSRLPTPIRHHRLRSLEWWYSAVHQELNRVSYILHSPHASHRWHPINILFIHINLFELCWLRLVQVQSRHLVVQVQFSCHGCIRFRTHSAGRDLNSLKRGQNRTRQNCVYSDCGHVKLMGHFHVECAGFNGRRLCQALAGFLSGIVLHVSRTRHSWIYTARVYNAVECILRVARADSPWDLRAPHVLDLQLHCDGQTNFICHQVIFALGRQIESRPVRTTYTISLIITIRHWFIDTKRLFVGLFALSRTCTGFFRLWHLLFYLTVF